MPQIFRSRSFGHTKPDGRFSLILHAEDDTIKLIRIVSYHKPTWFEAKHFIGRPITELFERLEAHGEPAQAFYVNSEEGVHVHAR